MNSDKKETRRGGLGRGLAALIPTAPENKPQVGTDAADIIFGRPKKDSAAQKSSTQPATSANSGGATQRNSDNSLTLATLGMSKPRRPHEKPVAKESQTNTETQAAAASTPEENSAQAERSILEESTTPAEHTHTAEHNTPEESVTPEENNFGATYREIPLGLISPNPRQPREVFDEEPLNELAHSIREFGLMQPIVVRVMPEEHRELARSAAADSTANATSPEYEIIMGERRWRAAQLAGIDAIPAIVRKTDDDAMLRDALLENIHRVQLNPLEEAAAYQQLLEEFQVTQAQLAEKIGRSRPVITNMIRLLKLPVDVQRRVAAGVLSAGHARALLGVKEDKEAQSRLAERIVSEGLSVRATEEAVTLLNRGDASPAKPKREPLPQPEQLTKWADRLADTFDTKVTASMGKRKGKLVIEFGDLDDFDRIMGLLNPNADN